MSGPDTGVGGDDRRFPQTSWTVIVEAKDSDSPGHREALEKLLADYWKPVYGVIRAGWNRDAEDAKDLTQEFFATVILEGPLVDRFSPERGSFRAFLRTAVKNFMRDALKSERRLKRGGGREPVRIDLSELGAADLLPDPRARTPEEIFDAAWRREVLTKAAGLLEERLRASGRAIQYEVFARYDLPESRDGVSYESVGAALGIPAEAVKNHLTAARAGFRSAVTDVVRDTVGDDRSLAGELEDLF